MAAPWNIGPKGVRRRIVTGWVMLVVCVAGIFTAIAVEAGPLWRASTAIPFGLAVLGHLQARQHT